MQYTSVTVLALAAAVSALPLTERDNSAFGLISQRSASPVHLQPISAREGGLWIGGSTETYCPSVDGLDCSTFKNETAFTAGNPGSPVSLSMSANVPGGQQVYIQPGGEVKYTQAHSASVPSGSVTEAFSYTISTNGFHQISPVTNGSNGFLACPIESSQRDSGPWKLFANVDKIEVPSGCLDDCWGIVASGPAVDGPTAWQYS